LNQDREKETKDRKKQDKNLSFFTKMVENGRVDKLPKLHKIKPTTAKAAEEKNLETVRKEISA